MIYAGEAQLARWAETSSGGATVTFWLPDGDALENFKLLTERKGKQAGQILAMVVKLVDESDLPDPDPEPKREKIGPLCRSAVELCKNADFQAFTLWAEDIKAAPYYAQAEGFAKEYMLEFCCIESRKDLDYSKIKAEKFAELMANYRAWIAQNRG